jgi:3-oxoacyl-[acyl-carrier protein] reductase
LLQKKTVIVTGAANGIGKAITKRCLQDGFRVWACDIDAKSLSSLKSEHSDSNLSIITIDISDYRQVQAFFDQEIKDKEAPSCLVNNAGIYLGKSILEYSAEEVHRVIQVNCFGAIYFSQQFAKLLIPVNQPGVIVNMSSVAGY